jgi:hypothetical protein
VREKTLVAIWGIDRSVAGRLVRAMRTHDSYGFLRELPSPEGLLLIAEAAARSGASEGDIQRLHAVVSAWQDIIDSFPGKRRALLTHLSSHDAESRERADTSARRAIFKSAAELIGYSVRHTLAAAFIVPASSGNRLDTIHVLGKYGLSRTREDGGPITVMGLRAGPESPQVQFLPIDPSAKGDRASDCLLPRYCRGRARIELVHTPANAIEMRLPPSDPAPHQEIDLVCGQRVPSMLMARRENGHAFEWYEVLPRIPSECLTVDLLLHESVYPGIVPQVTARLYSPYPPNPPNAPAGSSDVINSGAEIRSIGNGLRGIGISDIDGYPEMLREIAAQCDLELERFRAIRMTVRYPMLMSATCLWLPLA